MEPAVASPTDVVRSFNPCFNGFMDKWEEFGKKLNLPRLFQPLF